MILNKRIEEIEKEDERERWHVGFHWPGREFKVRIGQRTMRRPNNTSPS
jgi:hypothetical protein